MQATNFASIPDGSFPRVAERNHFDNPADEALVQ